MTTPGSEFKSSGITENTPKTVMLGAGTIHRGLEFVPETYELTEDQSIVAGKTYYTRSGTSPNYTYTPVADPAAGSLSNYYEATGGVWNFESSLICATSGGSKLTITPEFYDIPVDGALVKVKGLTQKVGEAASLEINPIEMTPEILQMAVVGTDGESSSATGYREIKSRAKLNEDDYIEKLGYVGKTLEGKPIIITFDYALCTSGLDLEGKNKEAAVPSLTFECYADLTPEADSLPWHIYYLPESN